MALNEVIFFLTHFVKKDTLCVVVYTSIFMGNNKCEFLIK